MFSRLGSASVMMRPCRGVKIRTPAEGCNVQPDEGNDGALRPLARDRDPVFDALPPDARDALATLLPGLGDGGRARAGTGDQAQVFEALLAVLDGLARAAPVLLVIEDLHWADASTRAFLRFLAAGLADEPLLVVATYRPDELHRRHPLRPLLAELERVRALRIDLGAFSRDELAEQLADILGAPPEAALVDRLFARTEGNALFTEELLAAGLDGRGAVPPSLAAALALRFERLGPDAQEVVRTLSAGGKLDDRVLAEVTGLEPRALRDALREAVESHIVVPDGDCYVLRHALVAEAVHDDLLPGERADLHRALARALQELPASTERPEAERAASIAHHFLVAGDQPAALTAAVRAGEASMRVQAYLEGATLFERALELWHRVPDASELTGADEAAVLERAAVCNFFARGLPALGHARAARARAGGRGDAGAARRLAARAPVPLALGAAAPGGGQGDARPRARAARRRRAEPGARRRCSRARRSRSWCSRATTSHVRVARQALAEQETLGPDGCDPAFVDEIGALNALGVSLMATGERGGGRAGAARRARAGASGRGTGMDRHRGGREPVRRAAPGRPHARRRSRWRAARATSSPTCRRAQAWLALLIAQQAFDAGDWEAADEAMRRRRRAPARLGRRGSSTPACATPSSRWPATSARPRAAHLERAAELAVDSREPQYLGVLGALQAELAAREGDVEAARAAVDDALDRIEFCSDDALRMAMVSSAGLAAEAGAAQHARDLGDEAAAAAALSHADLLDRARARVRRGRRRARGGLPRQAEADHCRALGADKPERWAVAADALGRARPPVPRRARRAGAQAEALVAAGDREAAAVAGARRARASPSGSAPPGCAASSRASPPARGCGWPTAPAPRATGERRRTRTRSASPRASARCSRSWPRARPTARSAASSTWRRRPPASTSPGSSRSSTSARARRPPASPTASGSTPPRRERPPAASGGRRGQKRQTFLAAAR